jgi:hypothetical protein
MQSTKKKKKLDLDIWPDDLPISLKSSLQEMDLFADVTTHSIN